MKKIIFGGLIAFVLFAGVSALAQTAQFSTTLKLKSQNYSEVLKLQNFLMKEGFLEGKADGKFGPKTKNAVIAFQASEGLKADGVFGPMSFAAANRILLASAGSANPATISAVSIQDAGNGLAASAVLSNSKTVTWQTAGYPANAGVDINLIRKTSDAPAAYAFVRSIVKGTVNDGQETFSLGSGENTNDLYVELACSSAFQFKQGCQFVGKPIPVK
jgi:peptidoglycan hydrolase-like protein with peptidoglycan-binding domain